MWNTREVNSLNPHFQTTINYSNHHKLNALIYHLCEGGLASYQYVQEVLSDLGSSSDCCRRRRREFVSCLSERVKGLPAHFYERIRGRGEEVEISAHSKLWNTETSWSGVRRATPLWLKAKCAAKLCYSETLLLQTMTFSLWILLFGLVYLGIRFLGGFALSKLVVVFNILLSVVLHVL